MADNKDYDVIQGQKFSKGMSDADIAFVLNQQSKGGKKLSPSFDQPKADVAKKRAAGEESLKSAKETLTSNLPLAGAAVGSMLVPGGQGLGVALGAAALGGAGGEAYRQLTNRVLGVETPQTSGEAALGIGKEAIKQGAYELGGRVVSGVAKAIVEPAKLIPEAKAVWETAKSHGMNLTAAEVTQGRLGKFVQAFTDKSVLGAGRGITRRKELYDTVNAAIENTAKRFGEQTNRLDSGKMLQDGVKLAREEFRQASNKAYGKVGEIIADTPVKLEASQSAATELLKATEKGTKAFPKTLEMDPELKALTDEIRALGAGSQPMWKGQPFPLGNAKIIERGAAKAPETAGLPFDTVKDVRSKVLDLMRQADKAGDRQKKYALGKLETALREDMTKTAERLGPEALTAMKDADRFYREGIETFEESVVADLMKKDPELFVKSIPKDAITSIKSVKTALTKYGDKGAPSWDVFRRQYTQNIFKDAEGKGLADFKTMKKNLDEIPGAVAKEVYSDERGQAVYSNMKALSAAAARVENLTSDPKLLTPGLVGMTLHDISLLAASSYFHTKTLGTVAGARLLAPALLTRVVNNKEATRFFIEGIGHVPTSLGKSISNMTRAYEIAGNTIDAVALMKEARAAQQQGQGVPGQGQQGNAPNNLGPLKSGHEMTLSGAMNGEGRPAR